MTMTVEEMREARRRAMDQAREAFRLAKIAEQRAEANLGLSQNAIPEVLAAAKAAHAHASQQATQALTRKVSAEGAWKDFQVLNPEVE